MTTIFNRFVDYDELTHFCKDKGISEVVLAGDIMSYHEEKYDILQQSASLKMKAYLWFQ